MPRVIPYLPNECLPNYNMYCITSLQDGQVVVHALSLFWVASTILWILIAVFTNRPKGPPQLTALGPFTLFIVFPILSVRMCSL